MHRHLRAWSFLAAFLAASTAGWAADETYPIRLSRPFKAGDAYEVHIVLDRSDTSTPIVRGNPQAAQRQVTHADIAGRVDIDSVAKDGSEKEFSLTLSKFTAGPDNKEVLPAGTVIGVDRSEKEVIFTMRGGVLSDDIKGVLGQIYDKINSTGITDDEVFGSKTPRKVGESWPADGKVAAAQAAGNSVKIDPADFKGESTLKGIEKVDNVPALRITSTLKVSDLSPILPTGYARERFEFGGNIVFLVPVDPAQPALQTETTFDTDARIAHVTQPVKIDRQIRQHQIITIRPVKK